MNDRYRTHSGTECEKSFDSGKDIELSVIGDPETDSAKVMLTLKVEFGNGGFESQRIDCRTTMMYEQDRMYLENERLRLELELLRKKVEGTETENTSAASALTDEDDW